MPKVNNTHYLRYYWIHVELEYILNCIVSYLNDINQ